MKLSIWRTVSVASATVFAIFVIAVSMGYSGSISFGIPGIIQFSMDGGGLPHVHLAEEAEQPSLPLPEL